MATNLEIDENLIKEALELGGHPTKDAVVEEALREYVQRRKQLKILELFGTIEYDDDYDYKQQRRSRGKSLLILRSGLDLSDAKT
jgi:Arc/MetJ family transcription regulator